MRMNTNIPMMGQPVNVLAAFGQGQQAGAQTNDIRQTNALRNMLAEQGPGIRSGDPNALDALSRFDPQAALGVEGQRQTMAHNEEKMRLAYEQARQGAAKVAMQMSAAERADQQQRLERGLAALTTAQTPEQWDMIAQQLQQPELVGQFAQKDMLFAQAVGLAEALKMAQGPEQTTGFQTLHQRAEAAGLQPGTPGYQQFMAEGGSGPQTVVNVGGEQGPRTGTIPQGYMLVEDPASPGGVRMAPIQGGPADTTENEAQRQRNTQMAGATVIQDLQRALDLLPELGALTGAGGVMGGIARSGSAQVPGTLVNRITQFTESALSNVGLDTLQRMREASPTGGALGQVPIQQQRRLEQVLGSLDITQPPDVLEDNIKRVINIYTDIIFGTADERERAVRQGRMSPEQSAEIDGYYYPLSFDARGRQVGGSQGQGQQGQPAGAAISPTPPTSGLSDAELSNMNVDELSDDDLLRIYGGQ